MIIFKTVVGSQLHGYATADSDTDYVTVEADPLRKVLSLSGDAPRGNQQHGENDSTRYELRHFCRLLVKGNPTVYDALFSHFREGELTLWDIQMTRNADKFIDTENIYKATRGYVQSTMKEAGNGTFRPERRGKKALAALRVLRQGQELLKTGKYDPSNQIAYDFAIALKNGDEIAIETAQEFVADEGEIFDTIYVMTRPKTADIDWINDFLYRVYTARTVEVKTMPKTTMTWMG